ncbi:MAG: DUF4911 domain-containing protein [Desulforhopalus sp.]
MASKRLSSLYLRISPDKFHYLKFILEGYDNLAILSSYQNQAGVVVLRYPKEMSRDLFLLLSCIAGYLAVSH